MLSATTEHALRALVELARTTEAIVGRDLAGRARIPGQYLAKILGVLAAANLVSAVRGTGGGYRLAVPAGSIRLVDVVALFEPASLRSRCLLQCDRVCSDAEPCTAHAEWTDVRARINEFLQGTTIAALATSSPPGELVAAGAGQPRSRSMSRRAGAKGRPGAREK